MEFNAEFLSLDYRKSFLFSKVQGVSKKNKMNKMTFFTSHDKILPKKNYYSH